MTKQQQPEQPEQDVQPGAETNPEGQPLEETTQSQPDDTEGQTEETDDENAGQST